MNYKKSGNTYVIRLERGEELLEKLTELCRRESINAASVCGLGASDRVVIGLYSVETKEYRKKELTGEMEITSLIGNVSELDGVPYLHFHITLCDEQLRVLGGHLNECRISATCELFLTTYPLTISRKPDEVTGLNLIEF